MSENLRVALVQMTSRLDADENLLKIRKLLNSASNFDAVFLPECFLSMSNGKEASPFLVEEGSKLFEDIRKLAIDFKTYLIGGSVAFLEDGKIYNRALNFDPEGNLLGIYNKSHLFSCHLKSKSVDESDIYTAGSEEGLVLNIKGFKIGIGICFDLRFADFFTKFYREQVDLISICAAFTVHTGRAHWHTLLRARAIEGQAYVIASAQVGQNHPNVKTYGHSLVIDPWGEVICDLAEEEGITVQVIEKTKIVETRQKIPMT